MMKSFLLVTFLANLSQINGQTDLYPSSCGLKFKDKILGGTDSEINAWPWMVSLQFNFEHICGGTLITNRFVLTAAHCILFPTSAAAYKVLLGGHNITQSGALTNAIRIGVSKIIMHENFNRARFLNDVALIKLSKPVEFTREIFPACMPLRSDNFENMNCYFVGWGFTYNYGVVPDTPREIMLPILSQAECSQHVLAAVEQKYCAGSIGSYEDTCKGDSGSGQMCLKADGRWYVGGIVSYGQGLCGNVGVQARVDFQRNWIDKNIADNLN